MTFRYGSEGSRCPVLLDFSARFHHLSEVRYFFFAGLFHTEIPCLLLWDTIRLVCLLGCFDYVPRETKNAQPA